MATLLILAGEEKEGKLVFETVLLEQIRWLKKQLGKDGDELVEAVGAW